jgi:ankyrin repeat protein
VIQCLLETRAVNLLATNENGKTVLHVAVEGGHYNVVKRILDQGAGSNAELVANMDQATILQVAADVDAADIDGYTALHLACRAGHLNIVEYLIESGGANVDAKAGVKRQTALYIASEHDS